MPVSNVHIKPVSPDPNASERYGSAPEERGRREQHAQKNANDHLADRLEISRSGRETFRHNSFGADMDFARRALDKAPPTPESRLAQIVHRIESGYYRLPTVIWSVVTRIIPALR